MTDRSSLASNRRTTDGLEAAADRDDFVVRRMPLVGLVGAIAIVVTNTLAPVLHATDEKIFRNALGNMRDGAGYYPAMRDALAEQGAAASQVRSFRLPTEFLVLRWLPESSYRWLAAAAVLVAVVLCWWLARHSHPALQAAVLLGSALWLSALLDAVYLYAEIFALPCFLAALVAVRHDRWVLAALALTAAVCVRELYLPALVIAMAMAPRANRRPFGVAVVAVAAIGAAHYWLASQQLVARGNEASFTGFSDLGVTLRSILAPRPVVAIAVPVAAVTILGVVGVMRSWPHDPTARIAGWTALVLAAATLFGGRVYWPLLFSPVLVAFAGAALPRPAALRPRSIDSDDAAPPVAASTT